MPGEVLTEQRERARWLTISAPPRNLLSPGLMQSLVERLHEADGDDAVRAIVLTGSGSVFCGGLDVEAINNGGNPVEFATALVRVLDLLPRLGKPVIAAVNGDALASGFSIAVAADWGISVPDARLGTFEASIGIWPMIAQVPPLQRLLPRHALSNIITGDPFSAQQAVAVGAINSVVASEELEQAVQTVLARVTRASPAALAAGRRSFYRFLDMDYHEALQASLEEFTSMFEGR